MSTLRSNLCEAQCTHCSLARKIQRDSDALESQSRAARPAPGLTRDVRRIITAVRKFDTYQMVGDHSQLVIRVPLGFYRYKKVTHWLDLPGESVDVKLVYDHRELQFAIALVEISHTPLFTIAQHRRGRRANFFLDEYRVNEPVKLSIRDARGFIAFLQDYFRCFNFHLTTKPRERPSEVAKTIVRIFTPSKTMRS